MKSARRKAYLERKEHGKKKQVSLLKFIIPTILLGAIFIFLKATTNIWNNKDKVSLVYKRGDGNIAVTVLDPTLSEMTTMVIPADTQVDVARNYGTILIKNVWQFGINEKIGGKLLAETVTQNFLFPTFLWSENDPGFDKGNVGSILNFIFFPGSTNINFGDRLRIGLFSLNVKKISSDVINLGESRFLEKKKLSDGNVGYETSGKISERLTVYFSDNDFSGKIVKIGIIDATGGYEVSDKLGEILEVLGGKVVSVEKKTVAEDTDCQISSVSTVLAKKVARIFSCKVGQEKANFDLDIKIGKKFADRF